MGEHKVQSIGRSGRAAFISHLLDDIRALDIMLNNGLIEDDNMHIGAEQEFCLVNKIWRPSTLWQEILEEINDPHFTTELARFNLELNLDPIKISAHCFGEMKQNLRTYLNKASKAAADFDTRLLLTGILPTISKKELDVEFMTPLPRYFALNQMMKELRGTDFELHIRGIDELSVIHESVLFEACNTSFQMHLQVRPGDFISSYNWAQAIAGPLLGICCNSPLLLGRELWAETRIALFQQSVDTRRYSYALKEQLPRVSFGNEWAKGSITEIYKNDIAAHKILLAREIEEKATDLLRKGKIPRLQALALHSGTIYHWNRPCYGVANGKAHVRIENRYIPAGPTVEDEIANFAFWVGMMLGRPKKYDDLPPLMEFNDAKSNFIKAARTGRESVMRWMGKQISVRDLITEELLPIARDGLKKHGIDSREITHSLGVIEERCKGKTGSQWIIRNYRDLKKQYKKDDALLILTKAMYKNGQKGEPVHLWPSVDHQLEAHEAAHLAAHVMSTQLLTTGEDDPADLAINIMLWKDIHHLPVENSKGELSGLLTWTHVDRYRKKGGNINGTLVSDIMSKDLITVRPQTDIKKAISLMKRNEIGCLPVVQDNHLVGIITINDVKAYDDA